MVFYIVVLIFFLGFFGNTLFGYRLLPPACAVLTELAILILFCMSLLKKAITHKKYHLHYLLVYYLLGDTLISVVVNSNWSMGPIYSLRNIMRFYILYVSLVNLELNEKTYRRLNFVLFLFVVLQLPVVAVKFMVYGISELTMGAYAIHEGSLTTMIPLVIIVYLIAYYYTSGKGIWRLVLALGFCGFAVVGKKRAIFFLLPVTLLLAYYLTYWKDKIISFSRRIFCFVLIGVLLVVFLTAVLIINPTLNPEKKVGGSADLTYALSFAKKYTTGVDYSGHTTGRLSTTLRVFKQLLKSGPYRFLFGFGPGKITTSIFEPRRKMLVTKFLLDTLGVKYGLTPFTSIMIEYGLTGAILYAVLLLWFVALSKKHLNYEDDKYWKGFAIGTYAFTILMLIFYFAYHPPAIIGDTLPLAFFYVMAVTFWRVSSLKKKNITG